MPKAASGCPARDDAVSLAKSRGRRKWRLADSRDYHFPSVDQIDLIVAVLHRQTHCPFARLMLAEIEI